jgi:hypothetical protein
MRDIEIIDAELRLVSALRRAAGERGGPLPSIDVADTLLDERRELIEWTTTRHGNERIPLLSSHDPPLQGCGQSCETACANVLITRFLR